MNIMYMRWYIILDVTGHYRPISDVWYRQNGIEDGGQIFAEASTYSKACKIADDLNSVSEIMSS